MTAAGFRDVTVKAVDAPLRLPSAAECLRFERESFGALHQMLAGVPAGEREDVWAEVETGLRQFETADGFVGPCELLVAWGTQVTAGHADASPPSSRRRSSSTATPPSTGSSADVADGRSTGRPARRLPGGGRAGLPRLGLASRRPGRTARSTGGCTSRRSTCRARVTRPLGEAARAAGAWVVVGVTERVPSATLYNSLVYLDPRRAGRRHAPQADTDRRRAHRLGQRRRADAHRRSHAVRSARRPDLLGEPDAARPSGDVRSRASTSTSPRPGTTATPGCRPCDTSPGRAGSS